MLRESSARPLPAAALAVAGWAVGAVGAPPARAAVHGWPEPAAEAGCMASRRSFSSSPSTSTERLLPVEILAGERAGAGAAGAAVPAAARAGAAARAEE